MDEAFDKQTKELIAAMNRTSVVQKYKGDMDTLVATADVAAIISDIEDEDNLSEEDKLVKLAMVVGNSDTWTRTGSFMHAYTAVSNDMMGKSYSSNMDFFTAFYEEQKANYQFSGEVLDVIAHYIQKMIFDYARYTTIVLASLDAQDQLIYGDFDASKITDKQLKRQYESLINDRTTIKKAKIVISKNLFGSEAFTQNGIFIPKVSSIKLNSNNYDNVFVHLNKLLSTNRLIHVPTGKVLNPDIHQADAYFLIDNDTKKTEQFALDQKESTTEKEYEDRITGKIENGGNHNCIYQKQKLIKKFEGMCSDAEIRQLISRITLNEKCSPSLDLLENLDLIHRLIADRRKINFEYGKYDTDKKIKYYKKKRDLLPVRVVYFNERIYLKCYNEADERWRIYRVDRMRSIVGGDVSHTRLPKEKKPEGFVTDMFEPEYFEYVTLRVKRYLLDDMLEHFGDYASISPYSETDESVTITVHVGVNQRFFLWVMSYGDGIELLSPVKTRSEYLAEVRKMLGAYPEFWN